MPLSTFLIFLVAPKFCAGLEERYCAFRKPELRCSILHNDRAAQNTDASPDDCYDDYEDYYDDYKAISESKLRSSDLHSDMAGLSTEARNNHAYQEECYEELDEYEDKISKPKLRSSDLHSDREDSRMMSVVLQQQIRGNWEYSAELLQLLNVSQDEFDKLDMSDDKDVIITLVALCWLQKQFSHRHEEWQMIEAKATAWLSTRHLPSNVEDLIKKTADKLWP